MTPDAILLSDWWTFLHDTRVRPLPNYNVTLYCLNQDARRAGCMWLNPSCVSIQHLLATKMGLTAVTKE
ncbi:DUF409 domain protein [Aspergillus luchuensis]|uniref:DUF409 domain protein n=1 Tax=Aspergillus kawachii TaxID=1069201 RepID=A0A146F841_ASPKA|nr:DUF409 domain protein [Aspergillus luchuensis]